MILRSWRGSTRAADAEAYLAFLRRVLLPELEDLGGLGAYVLRQDRGDTVEFQVLSMWESMDAVHRFTGPDAGRAVVPVEAERLLVEYDREAQHFEVLHAPDRPPRPS